MVFEVDVVQGLVQAYRATRCISLCQTYHVSVTLHEFHFSLPDLCKPWQRNNLNEPLDPFPFWVAAEQKGGQG